MKLVLWLILLFLVTVVAAYKALGQELPDAPQLQKKEWRVLPEKSLKLPSRTNRQTLTSPWFIVPNALGVGVSILNVRRAESRTPNASYSDALVPFVGLIPLNYLLYRFVSRPMAM